MPKCLVYDESTALTTDGSFLPLNKSTNDETDEIYHSTVYFQKNVKGRAIQSMLKKGMEKFREVIDEAKETHSIAAIQKLFPKEFLQQIDKQDQILDEYKRVEEALKNDEKLQEELKKIECRDAGNLLNFLEKELFRLEGEKKAHALYLLAERERYSRQARDFGNADFEDQFRNDAMTLYLENVLCEGVQRVTEDKRNFVRNVAKKIDRKATKTVTFQEKEEEEYSDESNTEEILNGNDEAVPDQKVVMDLLKKNVVPLIIDRIKNEQMVAQQRKYLFEAHVDIFKLEYERAKIEQERQICCEILNGIISVATEITENSCQPTSPAESNDSCDSREAERLASKIVTEILNEIIDSKFELSSTSSDQSSATESYDGDYSNVQSTSDADSTTEMLANQVVHNILNKILENSFSSTTDLTETQSDTV